MSGPFRTSPYGEIEQRAQELVSRYDSEEKLQFFEVITVRDEVLRILHEAKFELLYAATKRRYLESRKSDTYLFFNVEFQYLHSRQTLVEVICKSPFNLNISESVNVRVVRNAADLIAKLTLIKSQASIDRYGGLIRLARSLYRKKVDLPETQKAIIDRCSNPLGLHGLLDALPKEV